jgi:hypothetical protein
MILQCKKVGPWKNYLFGERVYIVLSLFAKSVLAWIIWSGTMAPVRDEVGTALFSTFRLRYSETRDG